MKVLEISILCKGALKKNLDYVAYEKGGVRSKGRGGSRMG